MKKWEYEIHLFYYFEKWDSLNSCGIGKVNSYLDWLNERGAEGWELISSVAHPNQQACVFKRSKT